MYSRWLWIFTNFYMWRSSFGNQLFHLRYDETANAKELPHRLLEVMRSMYEDTQQRVLDIRTERFMFEESPFYEEGYVMSEIIERYRKMVANVKNIDEMNSHALYDIVERLELIQKLYFEIYHLVNIMHEIPRKWQGVPEFSQNPNVVEAFYVQMNKKKLSDMEELAKQERKKMMKMLKKRRELIAKGVLVKTINQKGKREPYNIRWPIDYGWEIDEW